MNVSHCGTCILSVLEAGLIQPTTHSVLFEAIFHLRMLLLTHTIQIEFPILIIVTNPFQFFLELLVGMFFILREPSVSKQ